FIITIFSLITLHIVIIFFSNCDIIKLLLNDMFLFTDAALGYKSITIVQLMRGESLDVKVSGVYRLLKNLKKLVLYLVVQVLS
uniref:Uncharacterized protein n=1 Tax=Amphimedon queenslandica TaxID=400682 RepID=A0A1X7UNC8_AMPQE